MWGLCHDDGSYGYVDTFNFLPWSGSKNYLGFFKQTYFNYFLYADFSPQKLALDRLAATEGAAAAVAYASPNSNALRYGNGWNASRRNNPHPPSRHL